MPLELLNLAGLPAAGGCFLAATGVTIVSNELPSDSIWLVSMRLTRPDKNTALRLRSFFRDNHYDEMTLARVTGRNSPIMLSVKEKTDAIGSMNTSGPLAALLTLFFLEHSLGVDQYLTELPESTRADLEATGLIAIEQGKVRARVLLVPVEKFLIAGDRYGKLPDEENVEHVLSVNPPARFLNNLMIREPADQVLDLCTGNGVFALSAAATARQVVATDLNPRALDIADFNAGLNDIGNVEFRLGAGFEPVSGEKFNRIVCNPPYIITPTNRSMCTDNSQELDGFCRDLLGKAPDYLKEGGVLQMIFEWVELEGINWQHRLAGWFEGNACDAWVICSGYTAIDEYATARSQQALASEQSSNPQQTREWLNYFNARNVIGVRSGFVQLRRRQGHNWQSFTSLGGRVVAPVGQSVSDGFRQRDRFLALADSTLLEMAPRPAEGMIVQDASENGMRSRRLVKTVGLPVSFIASPAVEAMIALMNGHRPLAEICDDLADKAGVDRTEVRGQCCAVTRQLLSQGLLLA